MRGWMTVALLVGVMSTSTGCFRTHFVENPMTRTTRSADAKMWRSHLLWGLINLDDPVALSICPNGIERAKVSYNFWNMLVTGLTGGIYGAQTVKVWCKPVGGAAMAPAQVAPVAPALDIAPETDLAVVPADQPVAPPAR